MDVVTLGMAKADAKKRYATIQNFLGATKIAAWFDASMLAGGDGASVATIPDQGLAAQDLVCAGTLPTIKANGLGGKKTLVFGATSYAVRSTFGSGWGQPTYPQPNTLVAFVKVASTSTPTAQVLIGGNNGVQSLMLQDGSPGMAAGGLFTSGPNLKDDQWHIIVGVFGTADASLYVDGYLVGASTSQTQGSAAMIGLAVGGNAGGTQLVGGMEFAAGGVIASRLMPGEVVTLTRLMAADRSQL